MRTIEQLAKADNKEQSPTRSGITEELFEHIEQLQAKNKKLRAKIKKLKGGVR